MNLKELAQKIQLEITEEELIIYSEVFKNLEKSLINFQEVKTIKKIKPMNYISVGYLTLADLEKLKKRFSEQKINKKTLEINAETTPDGFILFKKNM